MNTPSKRMKKVKRAMASACEPDSDETFAFIAGYTDGGAPYGITWEDLEEGMGDLFQLKLSTERDRLFGEEASLDDVF